MRKFIAVLMLFSLLAVGCSRQSNSPLCDSFRKETQRVIEMYTNLLSRPEVKDDLTRQAIEREYRARLAELEKAAKLQNCS